MQVLNINEYQRNRFVKRVVSNLHGTLIGKKITMLGYAFKKDTSDTRESPAVEVVKALLADNPAEIAIFDPRCNPEDVKDEIKRLFATTGLKLLKPEGPIEGTYTLPPPRPPINRKKVYKDAYEASQNSSAILILTEWDQFRYPAVTHKDSAFHKSDIPARSATPQKPKLFRSLSELEILEISLKKKHRKQTDLEVDAALKDDPNDPSLRYKEEPSCIEGCRDCERGLQEVIAGENVEWARIAYQMKKPKWVFDGRGIVDVKEMEKLGFRVEAIGRAGTRSRLHGMLYVL
jgi:UDPglucose 6-dehydrogenase